MSQNAGITILVSPDHDKGMADLCRQITAAVHREWSFKVLPGLVILVAFFDSGVTDHPLREIGGRDDGKAAVKWHERNHEILGLGENFADAARDILRGGRGARLMAKSLLSVEDGKRHLVFEHKDTRQVFVPGPVVC